MCVIRCPYGMGFPSSRFQARPPPRPALLISTPPSDRAREPEGADQDKQEEARRDALVEHRDSARVDNQERRGGRHRRHIRPGPWGGWRGSGAVGERHYATDDGSRRGGDVPRLEVGENLSDRESVIRTDKQALSLRKRRGEQGGIPGVVGGRGVIPGRNAVPIGVEGGDPPCDAQGGAGLTRSGSAGGWERPRGRGNGPWWGGLGPTA